MLSGKKCIGETLFNQIIKIVTRDWWNIRTSDVTFNKHEQDNYFGFHVPSFRMGWDWL